MNEAFVGRVPVLPGATAAQKREAVALAEERVVARGADGDWKARDFSPDVDLAAALLAQGDRDRAQALLEGVLASTAAAADQGRSPARELHVYALAMAGRHDEAMGRLEQLAERGPLMHWWYAARLEPAFAGLRGTPRFAAWERLHERRAAQARSQLAVLRRAGVIPARNG